MKKVLIIEDYYALADIESLLCTMEGYEVKVAKSGDEGLAAFVDFQPDLVLLDLMLPGDLSGTQVLERIRSEMFVASDDATSGSVIAKPERISPSSRGASHWSFCAGVANCESTSMFPVSGAEQLQASEAMWLRPSNSASGA